MRLRSDTIPAAIIFTIALATPCAANFTPITSPVDNYTSNTTVLAVPLLRGQGCSFDPTVHSVNGAGQAVNFNYGGEPFWVPECNDFLWGNPPNVESAIPAHALLQFSSWDGTGNPPVAPITVVLTLATPARVFGFEATGNTDGGMITAVFKNGAIELGRIVQVLPPYGADVDARLFAAQSDTPITSVEITPASWGLAVTQVRFGQGLLDSVEVTQAIQNYQTFDDLKTSLNTTHDPPVPIVAGKPAVLRAYMKPLAKATKLKIHLTGVTDQTSTVTVPAGCQVANERLHSHCPSFDFYFTPPHGNWAAHLDVMDSQNALLEGYDLPMRSWDTDSVVVKASSVCDSRQGNGWNCEKASALSAGWLNFLGKILPSAAITRQVTNVVVRRDIGLPIYAVPNDFRRWWSAVDGDLSGFHAAAEEAADNAARRWTVYFGMVRPGIAGNIGGMAAAIPSHAAASRSSTPRLGRELNFETFSHEMAHTLGVRHTNINVAAPAPAAPGCYATAAADVTDWIYPDNRIQGAVRLEVGFDVARKTPLDPTVTFDVGSYCSPRWVAPLHYRAMVTNLTSDQGEAVIIRRQATCCDRSRSPIRS